jgi:hypothetical protein
MDAVVQVTWRSDGARWQLAWRDGSATRALAAPVTPADGALWTASFGLRGLVPDGRDGDLRLQHVGGGDLCVQQLRILRWTPPLAGASASAAALHAEADRLRARRHAAELEAMAEAAALHQAYAAERRAADPARVDSWKRRLHGLRERFMADLAAAGRAAAGRGLDLVDLRGRWDEAMDLAERGQAAAETRIAELETVLPP